MVDARAPQRPLLLELVWTNSHGSFALGVVLIAAGALDDGREKAERRAWVKTALAAALVTLVNPYGWHLHALVDRYLRGADPTAEIIQTHILGFASLPDAIDSSFVNGWSLAALVLLTVLSIRAVVRRKHVARAVVVLLAVAMAVYQVRNVALAVVMGVLLLHGAADQALERIHPASLVKRWWMAALVVVPGLLIGGVRWASAPATRPTLAWVSPSLGGEPFLHLLHALPDDARVFAPFKPSALVLWFESERGVKVLYDPRNDCYSAAVAQGALELDWPPPANARKRSRGVADFLEKYGTEYAVLPRQRHDRERARSRGGVGARRAGGRLGDVPSQGREPGDLDGSVSLVWTAARSPDR